MVMKGSVVLGMVAAWLSFSACNKVSSETETDEESVVVNTGFTDLETGQPVELMKDEETGYVLEAESGEPLDFYINMNTMDTFYGRTGTVVNKAIFQNETGYYELDEDKIRREDDQMKVVGTDDTAAPTAMDTGVGNTEIKVDGDELKIKQDGQKIKVENSK